MTRNLLLHLAFTAAICLQMMGCGAEDAVSEPDVAASPAHGLDRDTLRESARGIFGTLPAEAVSAKNPVTPEKITLGRILYYEPRLSKGQDISCNSCHALDSFGADAGSTSVGHRGQRGARNSPTVYNAAFHMAQFWDGRAPDVEEQAKGPVLNPIEMAMPDEATVLEVLRSIPGYAPLFSAAFPEDADPITYHNMALAIGAFERRLVTPSPFDAFLEGDDEALSDAQLLGLSTFTEVGCITCHNGPVVGGAIFQKLGLVVPYETEDPGRMAVTGNEGDRGFFKVPSLRNVERTAPYFHDGSIGTLDRAIRLMAKHQLGRTLDDDQVDSIRSFLESLTGSIDRKFVAIPELPKNGPDTPPGDRS